MIATRRAERLALTDHVIAMRARTTVPLSRTSWSHERPRGVAGAVRPELAKKFGESVDLMGLDG